jgi:hypothetical protein
MNREQDRESQRNAAASARNAKPVVRRAASQPLSPMDAHWQTIAAGLFEEGRQERDVMEALRRQGAKSYMAADAVRATRVLYRNVHHMAHRKEGLKAVVVGLAMWLGGVAIVLAAYFGDAFIGRMMLFAGGLFVAGIVPVVFGLFKVLTGSTVAIYLPEDQR